MSIFSDSIKSRVSLEELFAYYNLREGGGSSSKKEKKYFCFAHPESAASLSLFSDGHYYCYSCGKHGDIFSLVEEMEHCDFSDAVDFICEKFHIEKPASSELDTEFPVYLKATAFLQSVFRTSMKFLGPNDCTGYDEWFKRGFTRQFIDEYELGCYWSPNKDGSLLSQLVKRFGEHDFRKWGLVDKLGNFPLQNRIIMPLRNRMGKIISFVGRTVDGDSRKYLPIINNEFSQKASLLYLFYKAKSFDDLILVEGHIDALSLHASGYQNAVAIGGCNLTTEQLTLLGGKRIILSLDSDKAGCAGTEKIITENIRKNFDVCSYPVGVKDYNDMLIANSLSVTHISDAEWMARYYLDISADKDEASDRFFRYLHQKYRAAVDNPESCPFRFGINPTVFSRCIDFVVNNYGIDIDLQQVIDKIYF